MLRLERHIIRTLAPPTLGACILLAVVITTFYTAQILVEAVAEQHPLDTVLVFALLRLGIFLDVLLPTALCLGVILGLGQLYANHEITAMTVAGVGPGRLYAAVLVPALLAAVAVTACTFSLRPAAFKTLYDMQSSLAVRVDFDRVEPGRFVALGSNWLIYAGARSGDSLQDVMLQHRGDDNIELLRAGHLSREMTDDVLRLSFSQGVQHYQYEFGGDPRLIGSFESLEVVLEPPEPPERLRLRRTYSLSRLRASDNPDLIAEWQWRVVAPISTLLLALAAIPMSRVNPRQGRGGKVLWGVLLVVVYFSALGTAVHWVEDSRVPRWLGVWWVPSLLVAICALWLLARRYRDRAP